MTLTNKRLRLFCFPYAGGNEYIFRGWEKWLPDFVEVRAVLLPGRGARINHEPYRELSRLVNDLAMERQLFLDRPFAFFGHSMGALISFGLAQVVRDRYNIQPAKLFVSGQGAPHLPRKRPAVHDQPVEEIRTVLRELNGTPPEILENDEMMKLALPLLRADLQVVETYKCEPATLLDCPIVGFTGTEDADVTDADMQAWQMHTSGQFTLHTFSGGHFFIKTAEAQVLARLSQELMQTVRMVEKA